MQGICGKFCCFKFLSEATVPQGFVYADFYLVSRSGHSAAKLCCRTEAFLRIARTRHASGPRNGRVWTKMGASSSERMSGFEAAEGSGERQFMSTTFVERGA